MHSLSDRPKIAGPEKGHELILDSRLVRRDESLETDKSFAAAEHYRLVVVEISRRKRDIADAVVLNSLKDNPSLKIVARMEKAEAVGCIPPNCAGGQKTDPSIKIVVKILQVGRKLLNLWNKRFLGKCLRLIHHVLIVERVGVILGMGSAYSKEDNKQRHENSHKRMDDGSARPAKQMERLTFHTPCGARGLTCRDYPRGAQSTADPSAQLSWPKSALEP